MTHALAFYRIRLKAIFGNSDKGFFNYLIKKLHIVKAFKASEIEKEL